MHFGPDEYVSMPALVIGGDLHGSVIEPGRADIQLISYKEPLSLASFNDDPRPFIRPVPTEVKTINIERIHFEMSFAVDDTDGTTKDQVIGHLNGILRDIHSRLMDEVYYQDQARKNSRRGYFRSPVIKDRRTWVDNFLTRFFKKRPSKHWELNG